MTATTIKVSTETRDAINALAAERGTTAGSVVEQLLDDYLWQQKVEKAVRQMNSMTDAERAEYMAELREWDVTLADGLDGW